MWVLTYRRKYEKYMECGRKEVKQQLILKIKVMDTFIILGSNTSPMTCVIIIYIYIDISSYHYLAPSSLIPCSSIFKYLLVNDVW